MRRRYRVVALGGTFDRLHVGHRALLGAAFEAGDTVLIGVTSDRYLRGHPKGGGASVRPFAHRARSLRTALRTTFPGRAWALSRLDDRFGRAVEPGVDALVVSAETEQGGRAVNAERRRRGLAALPLIVVPLVLADDLAPVSSTRVRAGELTRLGHRLGKVSLEINAGSPRETVTALRAARSVFPNAVRVSGRRRSGRTILPSLRIDVRTAPRGGWTVRLSSPTFSLPARRSQGSALEDLAWAVRSLLRPAGRKSI